LVRKTLSFSKELRKPRQDLGYKGVQYPLQKDPLDLALFEHEKPCFLAMNTAHRRDQGLGEVWNFVSSKQLAHLKMRSTTLLVPSSRYVLK
jgi:hypothetical protein